MLAVTAVGLGSAGLAPADGWTRVGILRNALLAIAAWLALMPGLRNGGAEFGRQFHWTGALFAPAFYFTIVALLQMWQVLTS